jgi:hypothetical protein
MLRHGLPLLLALSVVCGLVGGWSLWEAANQYSGTLRSYTQLNIAYQPGSFVWLEPDYSRARLAMVVTNGSPADATVQTLNVHLLFDGEFAGTNYETTPPFTVDRGASREVVVELQVTSGSIREQGGAARLSLAGAIVARFSGIQRELALRVRDDIGVVDRVEPGSGTTP